MSAATEPVEASLARKVGVVIIGRNEGQRLINCLKSAQVGAAFVVYVDSGSTDGSVEAARATGASVVCLDPSRPFSAARARNEGAFHILAHSGDFEFLQFIDGDCELRKDWLNAAMTFMAKDESVAIVCGRRRERDALASVYNRLCDIEWDTPVGQTLSCGGDFLARASAFRQVGGFADHLIAGEEPELCARLRARGWKIWRLNAEMTLHDANLKRFAQWWLRAARGGHAMAEVAFLHWASAAGIWKKELLRAFFWALIAPAIIVGAAAWHPMALLGLLIYPAQITRIAISRGATRLESWRYALFMTLAKFAEFQGAVIHFRRALFARRAQLIEYK